MRDFLTALALWRAPTIIPAPPIGITHFAQDPIFYLRAINSRAGVSHRFARHADLLIQFCRSLGRLQRYLEFGPLVFLHPNGSRTVRPARNVKLHRAHEPITGRGEAAGEGAVIVATMFLMGHFLAV